MFNKTNKTPPRAEKPQSAPVVPPLDAPSVNFNKTKPAMSGMGGAKPFSSVGSGLMVDGNITGSGDLHLDGTVKGDVKVNHLTVGESGNIEGKVEAETIEVRGRIVGSIQGKQIKLQATAYVEGDITHEQLAIDVGAYFQGRCLQRRSETVVTPGVASPAENTGGTGPMTSYDMSALSDLT